MESISEDVNVIEISITAVLMELWKSVQSKLTNVLARSTKLLVFDAGRKGKADEEEKVILVISRSDD